MNVRNAYNRFAATNGAADFWLMLGDNAYNRGLDTEYQSAVFDMYPDALRNLFLWPALGNHESDQSFSATAFPYLDIFSPPEQGEAGGLASGNRKYYSFNYGDIHFICLDSMTSGRATNSVMVQWLVDDLAASTATWNVVFFHHPPYTHGSHNSDVEAELIEVRQNIVPILEANGVGRRAPEPTAKTRWVRAPSTPWPEAAARSAAARWIMPPISSPSTSWARWSSMW